MMNIELIEKLCEEYDFPHGDIFYKKALPKLKAGEDLNERESKFMSGLITELLVLLERTYERQKIYLEYAKQEIEMKQAINKESQS